MTFLSVGKNEVAHLRVGKDHWLINAGRDKPSDQVEWIVGPYLKSQGVKRLAGIIWTDELKKHTSGARTLARDFKWYWDIQPNGLKNAEIYKTKSREKIYLNDDDCFSLNQKIRICRRGDFDGKTFWLDIQMGKNQVWFFPADHPQTMQKLRAEIKKRDIDYLYVPEKMLKRDELYEFINPKVIISSSMSKASVDALVARDIEFIDLQLTGAVSLIPYGPNRMVGDFFLD